MSNLSTNKPFELAIKAILSSCILEAMKEESKAHDVLEKYTKLIIKTSVKHSSK